MRPIDPVARTRRRRRPKELNVIRGWPLPAITSRFRAIKQLVGRARRFDHAERAAEIIYQPTGD